MIKAQHILNAVNDLLVGAYPQMPVYIDRIPQKFKRPSFFIKYLTSDITDANKDTVKVKFYLTITIFGKKDQWYDTDTMELLELQSGVLALFRVGKLDTEDNRSINIKASSGGSNEDEYYIDLQGEFFDEREIKQETGEMVEEVITNYKGRG